MGAARVLQVLPDTDDTTTNLAGLDLHALLAGAGVEVRTLALSPGRIGALAEAVPVMAPGRRSLAAHTQLRSEQRWADVVLLQGAHVAGVAAWAGGDAVPVLVLSDEPARWAAGERVPRRVRQLAARAAAVVVAGAEDAGPAADRLGVAPEVVVVVAPPASAAAGSTDGGPVARWLDVVHSALPSRP